MSVSYSAHTIALLRDNKYHDKNVAVLTNNWFFPWCHEIPFYSLTAYFDKDSLSVYTYVLNHSQHFFFHPNLISIPVSYSASYLLEWQLHTGKHPCNFSLRVQTNYKISLKVDLIIRSEILAICSKYMSLVCVHSCALMYTNR